MTKSNILVPTHAQVHKETVSKVPNAVPGRDNIDVEIFGLEGIPEGDRIAHEQAVQGESMCSLRGLLYTRQPLYEVGWILINGACIPSLRCSSELRGKNFLEWFFYLFMCNAYLCSYMYM